MPSEPVLIAAGLYGENVDPKTGAKVPIYDSSGSLVEQIQREHAGHRPGWRGERAACEIGQNGAEIEGISTSGRDPSST